MLKLKDIVQLDIKGQFRSDVQLSDYDRPELNRPLLDSYIFSSSVPRSYGQKTTAIAALGLLEMLIKTFTYERFENRLVVTANYGHGKSHLALVLANYFARPPASKEVRTVYERIDQALNNPAKAQQYREFKQERGEFLILRLRGDDQRPLREQFFRALQYALSEHVQTQDIELPFWVKQATQYLSGLSPEMVKAANKFLREFDMDVPALLQDVAEYREQAYERYVELFKHLSHGIAPSTEGNVTLSEAIEWVIQECCGEGKPLAGLLILFDEFSLYVQRYASSRQVGELQDLLQGVANHPVKAVFLAFAQHDPDEVAEQTLHAGQPLQNLKKELSRLPKKFALYSLMESVLDSYLKQSPGAWEEFLKDPGIKGAISGAAGFAWDTFSRHYDIELGWDYEQFREVVGKGCFPLHPLTTVLLCQLKMQQGEDVGTARTVLGFVRDQLDLRANEPAHHERRVNWILPIALVDYFERRLAGDSWRVYEAYDRAVRELEQAFGDEATDVHRDVLKALLLQDIARLPITNRNQTELLGHLCGLDEQTTLQALKQLSQNNIISFDQANRINRFWPVGTDPKGLEKAIHERMAGLHFEPDQFVEELNHLLRQGQYSFGSAAVEVDWGHPGDWAADEYIVTPDALNADRLRGFLPHFRCTARGLEDGRRGLVLWVLTRDEVDREALRERVRTALTEAWPGETPPPVVVIIPRQPVPELEQLVRRKKALESVWIDRDLVKQIGQDTYEQDKLRTQAALIKALDQIRGDSERLWDIPREPSQMVVPQPYQAPVAALPKPNLKRVLKQLYDLAYRVRPPAFFTHYPAMPTRGTSKLRPAIQTVAKNLIYDRVGSALSGMDSVSKDLCEKFLSKWGLLTSTYALQKPQAHKLEPAWELFERSLQPGVQEGRVDEIILKLLNPPHGFDYNTAMLLLCAWIGYHRAELRLSAREYIGLDQLEKQIETVRTSKDFLQWVCQRPLTISRRDPGAALQEANTIISRLHQGELLSQDEAEEALQSLEQLAGRDDQPSDTRQRASENAGLLRLALEAAQKYDQEAQQILANLNSERNVASLLTLLEKIKGLPVIQRPVAATQPAPSEIEARLNERLEEAFGREEQQAAQLKDITRVGVIRERLSGVEKQLTQQGLTSLVERIKAIDRTLKERVALLKSQEQEELIRREIDAMSPQADLEQLYHYRERLNQIEVVPEGLQQKLNQKRDAVEREIQELEGFANRAVEQAHNLDLATLDKQREKTMDHYNRCRGTEFQSKLDQAKAYLDTLRQFWDRLAPLSQHPLNAPADFQRVRGELDQIDQLVGQKLSVRHHQILMQARNNTDQKEQEKQRETIRWLKNLEREFERGISPGTFKQKLERQPDFLPSECQDRLMSLRARVQARLDQDQISQIEALFVALGTPQKRRECLERLQQLVAQEVA